MAKRFYDFRIDVRGWSVFDNDDEWAKVPVEMTDKEVKDLLEKDWAFLKSEWFKKNYDSGMMDGMIGMYAPDIYKRVMYAINEAAPRLWPDAIDKTDQFDIYLPEELSNIQLERMWNEEKGNNQRKNYIYSNNMSEEEMMRIMAEAK